MWSSISLNLDQSKILLSGNGLMTLRKESIENIVEKERKCCQQFPPPNSIDWAYDQPRHFFPAYQLAQNLERPKFRQVD